MVSRPMFIQRAANYRLFIITSEQTQDHSEAGVARRHTHMGNRNSLAEGFYLRLFIASYTDVASASAYQNVEFTRDVREIEHRTYHEGLSFLTRTLPLLGKSVDTALATGTPLQCTGFKLYRNTKIPAFMRRFLKEIFDDDGCERSDASAQSLMRLRQACALCYKLEVPTTKKQNNETIELFKNTDKDLPVLFAKNSNTKHGSGSANCTFTHASIVCLATGSRPRDSNGKAQGCAGSGGPVSKGTSLSVGHIPDPCKRGTYLESSTRPPAYRGDRACATTVSEDIPSQDGCHGTVAEGRRNSQSAPTHVFDALGRDARHVDTELDKGGTWPLESGEWNILHIASRLIKRVAGMYAPHDVRQFAARHGPGAVSGGELPHEKPLFKRYYRRLAAVFPYEEYMYYNGAHLCDELSEFLSREESDTGIAKVVLVPKDSRGPRLISCEPVEYQWIQQGLRRVLEHAIESCDLTSGRINFRDQTVNRDLALQSSKDGNWVTLDMKEASDRVSVALIKQLFPGTWVEALLASRTSHTKLPSGEVFQMKKYAPMGSALCFPVESLIFWALSMAAIIQTYPSVTASQAASWLYVFGDDIIVRTEVHGAVLQHLPSFGLLFNKQKCCTAGSFRESCGCDAFKGVDITPLRVKSVWDRRSGSSLVSYATLHNAAAARGMFNLADMLAEVILRERLIPYSESTEKGYVCLVDHRKTADWVRNHNSKIKRRYNVDLQRVEIKTWLVRGRSYTATTPGWAEMQRLASYSSLAREDVRLAPDNMLQYDRKALREESANRNVLIRQLITPENLHWFLEDESLLVRAYQYALPRQAILRRGWSPM
jgi:hypothetical protein